MGNVNKDVGVKLEPFTAEDVRALLDSIKDVPVHGNIVVEYIATEYKRIELPTINDGMLLCE